MYSSFVYNICLEEVLKYIGTSIYFRKRRTEHGNDPKTFKQEKYDFVMTVMFKVQSVNPAAAVFLAQSLEKYLQYYVTEKGVKLRCKEQEHADGMKFQTPEETREAARAWNATLRLNPDFVADQEAKRKVRERKPEVRKRKQELQNAGRKRDRENGISHKCDTCGQKFTRKDDLKTHNKKCK